MKRSLLLVVFFSVFAKAQSSDFNSINFKKADSIAALYKGESLKNLPVLTHNLTANLPTAVEKFRAIYTWVSTNIENDYSSYLTTRKKRKKLANNREAFLEWNASYTPKVFKNLLTDSKTACTGYAYLIREMANLTDLNCEIVNGYGRTPTLLLNSKSNPNHSWNKIKIDGKWYLCDATWSAGRVLLEENGPRFQSDYFDAYFLANPQLFVKNHYPLELGATLIKKPPSFEEFIEGPVVYREAFNYAIIPLTPKKMHLELLKNESITFKIQVPNNFKSDNLLLALNNGGTEKIVHPKIDRNPNNLTLHHTFDKTGLYDVHIKVDDAYIITYVVRVKRK